MRPTLRLAAAILLALPLLAACGAVAPEPTAAPSAEVTAAASPTEAASPTPDAEPACAEVQPDPSEIETIQATVHTANTEPLVGYVAETVNVVLAASEAYGPRTGYQAVVDFSDFLYLDQSLPPAEFDFAVPEATVDAYRAGEYAEYFPPTALVARDTDGRVIAFSFDCDGLIDTMLLVPDDSLLL